MNGWQTWHKRQRELERSSVIFSTRRARQKVAQSFILLKKCVDAADRRRRQLALSELQLKFDRVVNVCFALNQEVGLVYFELLHTQALVKADAMFLETQLNISRADIMASMSERQQLFDRIRREHEANVAENLATNLTMKQHMRAETALSKQTSEKEVFRMCVCCLSLLS